MIWRARVPPSSLYFFRPSKGKYFVLYSDGSRTFANERVLHGALLSATETEDSILFVVKHEGRTELWEAEGEELKLVSACRISGKRIRAGRVPFGQRLKTVYMLLKGRRFEVWDASDCTPLFSVSGVLDYTVYGTKVSVPILMQTDGIAVLKPDQPLPRLTKLAWKKKEWEFVRAGELCFLFRRSQELMSVQVTVSLKLKARRTKLYCFDGCRSPIWVACASRKLLYLVQTESGQIAVIDDSSNKAVVEFQQKVKAFVNNDPLSRNTYLTFATKNGICMTHALSSFI